MYCIYVQYSRRTNLGDANMLLDLNDAQTIVTWWEFFRNAMASY